ncbi:competence protein ComK [Pisciglobus halotolerans]|uniref:ComK protein n=1 Tax=Pisciglobus halotolerans TaxID=745365 RepID=A0A1I3AWW7_9LACT|nr:competence protein ComK [Pisciglobus halotolerans]SFH54440.1 ComK protein [Pisciglobus halotolerans]
MKDFFSEEYKQYLNRLRKECDLSSIEAQKDVPFIHSDHVFERDASYTSKYPAFHLDPLRMSFNELQELLDISFEHQNIHIDEQTFYIMDLSHQKQTPFNSLVFQLDQVPMKSKESTFKITSRYFAEKNVPYSYIQYIGKAFGIKKRCPYICGDQLFVPEKGAGNNKNASWIGLHHVLHYNINKKTDFTYLYFRNQHQMIAPISSDSFKEQLKRSATLYHAQHLAISHFLDEAHYSYRQPLHVELNIVQQKLRNSSPPFKPYSFHELIKYFIFFSAQESLIKVFKKDNPYLDDLRKTFKIPSFDETNLNE